MQKIPYELRVLAVEEMFALRQNAKPTELARLDYWALRPATNNQDVFGQMSQRDNNRLASIQRTAELIALSLVPMTNYGELNRSCPWVTNRDRPFTALELYMCHPMAENRRVVDFLRGERPIVVADDL